jgi:hypothetical protein
VTISLEHRFRSGITSWRWWYRPVIPAPRRLKDLEFKARLGYTARPFLKKSKTPDTGGSHL